MKTAAELVLHAYWDLLGRAPDPGGGDAFEQMLHAGGSVTDMRARLLSSEEAQQHLSQLRRAAKYRAHGVQIPFSVRVAGASKRLFVAFPGLLTAAVPPAAEQVSFYSSFGSCLVLGCGDNPPQGTEALSIWATVATQLIIRQAERLGVGRDDIWCCGESFSGTRAALVGLRLGTGRIVTGAPCLSLGSALVKLSRRPRPDLIFTRLLTDARLDADVTQQRHLDQLWRSLAVAAEGTAQWHILTSERDLFHGDAQLAAAAPLRPDLEVILHESDFAGHNLVGPPFRDLVVRLAREDSVTRPEGRPGS